MTGDSVRLRVNELEKEKLRLESSLSKMSAPKQNPNLVDLGQEVARFILNFEKHFAEAKIEERKVLVQQCIEKIEVDKEANVARFYVRRVPAILPVLREGQNRSKNEGCVMSTASARNRIPHRNRAGFRGGRGRRST